MDFPLNWLLCFIALLVLESNNSLLQNWTTFLYRQFCLDFWLTSLKLLDSAVNQLYRRPWRFISAWALISCQHQPSHTMSSTYVIFRSVSKVCLYKLFPAFNLSPTLLDGGAFCVHNLFQHITCCPYIFLRVSAQKPTSGFHISPLEWNESL